MFKKYTDKQDQERYDLLNAHERAGFGGCVNFKFANVETLKQLVKKGYLDPEDKQNDAPIAGEFIKFMEKYPEFEAHGYIIDNEREDRRITIEGIYGLAHNMEAFADFEKMFHEADEFWTDENNECYCWYD